MAKREMKRKRTPRSPTTTNKISNAPGFRSISGMMPDHPALNCAAPGFSGFSLFRSNNRQTGPYQIWCKIE